MSQIAMHHADDHHAHAHVEPHIAARAKLDLHSVTLSAGAGRVLAGGFVVVGLVACVVLGIMAYASPGPSGVAAIRHALGAYHLGVLYAVGLLLGCLGTQMIFQQFNAGWSAAVRRQCENVASLAWVVGILFVPVFVLELWVTHGALFKWMDSAYTAKDPIYAHKSGWLNPTFWAIRSILYFVIWGWLGARLYRLSRLQDETGDKWITAKSRHTSSYGLLAFALTTAFASFDWLMSLDYHWFSTMFGVYFFAGSIVSSTALMCVILCSLRLSGKMGATFTQEHQHDLGKMLFAFTVFWAYITICQYFLIWYSNIPEETAFYVVRKQGFWRTITIIICAGHFAIPFLLLLIRKVKRNPHTLRFVALWMLVMHAVDLFFLVRPVLEKGETGVKFGGNVLIDICGLLGPVCLFIGFILFKIGKAPLVPIKDPRLHEVLEHKNYV